MSTSTISPNEPSICIPRVFANITEARVRAIIRELDLGAIERIDMVERENQRGEKYQRVFIHFQEWYNTMESGEPNESAIEVRRRLVAGEEVKVVYDDPWFWKLSASKSARPEDRKPRQKRPRPFLDLTHKAPAKAQQPKAKAQQPKAVAKGNAANASFDRQQSAMPSN